MSRVLLILLLWSTSSGSAAGAVVPAALIENNQPANKPNKRLGQRTRPSQRISLI